MRPNLMSAPSKSAISFEQAVEAFDDPFALIAPDQETAGKGSPREWLIGEAGIGTLVVVYTLEEDGSNIHLISARKANKQEVALYEVFKGVPVP